MALPVSLKDMKKSLSLLFILIALFNMSLKEAEKIKKSPEDIIEGIENKYKELQMTSPSVKAKGKEVAKIIRFIQPEDKLINDYSKLKQIALVRHGKPDMELEGQFTSDEANQYLKCYDSVCIIVPEKPFFQIGDNERVKIFSSPINRALTTAQYILGTNKEEITISPVFREFESKIGNSTSGKKKSINFWKTTSRIAWMLGGGKKKGIESFSDAKKRAKEAANILASASEGNQKVMLTAHGFLNRYIKKNLKKMGWKVVEDTGNGYFGTTILVKVE